jgi:hypothetical protein
VVVSFRITYARWSELGDDVTHQMARGGLLVRVDVALGFDAPVSLELVLPDGTVVGVEAKVLQRLEGHGVAVTVDAELVDEMRRRVATGIDVEGAEKARHERIDSSAPIVRRTTISPDSIPQVRMRATTAPIVEPTSPDSIPQVRMRASTAPIVEPPSISPDSIPQVRIRASTAPIVEPPPERSRTSTVRPMLTLDSLTQAQKIHMAMHGTRDERNAILRDQNRALHPFVLKNPQLTAEDVLEICKNALTSPALLKLISERKDWVQRGPIAVGLARNPKTPPSVAVQVLAYVPMDALRIMAKGSGVLPHVAQAARKKVIGK